MKKQESIFTDEIFEIQTHKEESAEKITFFFIKFLIVFATMYFGLHLLIYLLGIYG